MTVEEIFLVAVEKPADERAAYLDAACAGNTELRAQVDALVRSHERAGGLLEKPLFRTTPTIEHAPPAAESGTFVGPYKLAEQIGEGGMGSVWMAQQTEPVKRLVALKLIKPGMDSRQVIARFEAERQALALMDHPNIARVLDAGTTDAGRPYFVMDLVRGVPITKYCDEHCLTPRQRLELFLPVCQAVQHAHQKGVIHRDLKPSNVLVALYDGKPVPKVIDFGVAKAAGQPLTEQTLVTGFGNIVGTLEYMSPEQAEINQLDIDTRSDIYSLGVLLYELLTGSTPFRRKELEKAGMLEMLRVIREQEPSKPSTKLSTAEGLPTLAANRGTEPAKLTKLVRGELDWIAMKALEKDRARRYETANALARDVQRYLADEVVEARPPSVGYRVRKFALRHRGSVVAGSLILLALIGGLIGLTYGLIEAGNQRVANSLREQAERDRDAAETARDGEQRARGEAETAWKDAEAARAELFREKEKLAVFEYGRTMQLALQEWRENNVPASLVLLESTRADLRGWEWHFVHHLCHSDLLTLEGHTHFVRSASWSADGSRIVTGSDDRTAKVWDAKTGKELLTFNGHANSVRASWSADGSRIVTGSRDQTAKVWDAKSGAELLTLKGHTGVVWSASWSADGSRIVTGSWDQTAKVWDAKTGAELLTLKGHTSSVWSASWSADGSRIVTSSWDQTVKVWDAKTGAELLTLKGHTGVVRSASWSADGLQIVTGSDDQTAKVWDAKTGAELLTLKGHSESVPSASWSADGARIVTGSWDRMAKVWDAKTGAELLTLKGHTGSIWSASWSADGSRIVTGSDDRTAKVWDAKTGAELLILKYLSRKVAPAPHEGKR